jgi:hypothetical protein
MKFFKSSILALLAAAVLTVLPITVGDSAIRFQQAFALPACQDGGVIGTGSCRRYVCAQTGQCLRQVGWRPVPILGGAETTNVPVYGEGTGCIQWKCAIVLSPCQPGYVRIGARCVPKGTGLAGRICRAYSRCDGCPTVECRVGSALKVGANCGCNDPLRPGVTVYGLVMR